MTSPPETTALDRAPTTGWGRSWSLALAVFIVVMLVWELSLRAGGIRAQVQDSHQLWAASRLRLDQRDADAIVLVGRSRIQLGADLDVIERATGVRPVQLAVNAAPATPTLAHLARSGYRGILIFSFTPNICADGAEPSLGRQAVWIGQYEQRSAVVPVEAALGSWLDRRLALRAEEGRIRNRLKAWQRDITAEQYLETDVERRMRADFSQIDVATMVARRLPIIERLRPAMPVPQLEREFAYVESLVRQITDRGGVVVFVSLPSSGPIAAILSDRCPREACWDVLVRSTTAVTIHHDDEPTLGAFATPDGIHFDQRDSAAFTRALVAVVAERLGGRWPKAER